MIKRKKMIPGKELRKLLIDADVTILELARELGCSYDYLRQILKDQRKASVLRLHIKSTLQTIIKERSAA
jgi:hypothetical protein